MGQDGDLMADSQMGALLCLYLPEDLNIQILDFLAINLT